jgi:hypothetical protein
LLQSHQQLLFTVGQLLALFNYIIPSAASVFSITQQQNQEYRTFKKAVAEQHYRCQLSN